MSWKNTAQNWGGVAKSLHWIMAILIAAVMTLGWIAEAWRLSPTKIDLFVWHKSLGLTVLMLALVRAVWRLANPTPRLPESLPRSERRLARVGHVLLYSLMVAMPLSGWVINSASDFPLKLYGWLPWPNLVSPDKDLQRLAETVHVTLLWTLIGVLSLHIAAALRHHFFKRNDVLARMLPWHSRKRAKGEPE